MKFGAQIYSYRKKAGLTQQQLAEKLDVSFQAVSSWETDAYLPDAANLVKLANALHTTVEKLAEPITPDRWTLRSRVFDETHMYTYVKSAAQVRNCSQTLAALPYAKEKHVGQIRKGDLEPVPYIIHPLMMTCHAMAMGLYDDDVLAALLLHDVVEDCGVTAEQLPVGDPVKTAVALVSHNVGQKTDAQYFADIQENPLASLIKCIDRVNNLSHMAMGFTKEKMAKYVIETETYIVPLLDVVKNARPEWNNAAWLLRYQMVTLLETYKRLL